MSLDEPARKRPRKATRIQTVNRDRILAAALEIFSRFGFRGTTLDEIAREAGMSKSNLLYYYPSKAQIYKAVLEEILDEWLKPLRALDVAGDPAAELGDYIARKLDHSAKNPKASRLFANEVLEGAPAMMDVLKGPLKDLVDAKAGVIRIWIDEGRLKPVDPYHLVFMIWATTQHYADFETQISAITGRSIAEPGFHKDAEAALKALFLQALIP
ncbi:TetR family transcriptional regulator [Breoghania corrubedonensis]|uniref:TetR family transcriptional regulator n=1 Tax=Breoghania corrubedonensis TaxID=665038 RepID=A0A2T5V7N2_9HYPH|nr:TetR family transcriptional regulator C-terminal domain-containing protein [Breoghania corrubedonensis]PTW59746.1 TetR family transcriptional regulator [Breoghania corrubedonensis]